MDSIVKGYISTAISLILFGLILTIIIYASQTTDVIFQSQQEEKYITSQMRDYRQLYAYRNKIVSGDDVLLAVKKYTRLYDVEIELGAVGGGNWLVLDSNGTDDEWDVERIRGVMGDNVYDTYKSQLVTDSAGNIIKITFSRK